jgi:hypothetical protein
MTKTDTSRTDDIITLDDDDLASARVETFTVDLYGNDTLEAEDTLDIVAIEDDDAAAESSKPPLTAGGYFNDINRDLDESKTEDAPDIIVIEDDDGTADVVYGSSNSCEPVIEWYHSNDTITGEEEGPIDIIASAEDPDLDDLDIIDLTNDTDKDAHAAYGGSNSCEPYAGDNTCEPPEDLKSNDNPHTEWIDLL